MQQYWIINNSNQLNMFPGDDTAHLQEHWTVCYSLWYNAPTMLPAAPLPGCNTQCSAHEDGRDHGPKYVELIGIINKPLLLHLVGVHITYIRNFPLRCILYCNLPQIFSYSN